MVESVGSADVGRAARHKNVPRAHVAGQEGGYSIHLKERGLLVSATRGLLRRRAAVIAKLEECRLLRAVLVPDLVAPKEQDFLPFVTLVIDPEIPHAYLMALRLHGRPICRPVGSARAKLGKIMLPT